MKTKKIFEFIVQSMLILSVVFFYGCGGNGNEDPDPQMNDDENNGNPNTLTIKSLEPGSPGMLSSMQPIFVEFDYDIVEDDEVQIAVVPYFDGDQFSDFYTWLVPVSMGKGSGGNFVTVGPGGAEVDQIALLIRNESNTSTIETFLFDAD